MARPSTTLLIAKILLFKTTTPPEMNTIINI